MAKTKEELQALKQECQVLTSKLKELSETELNEVTGGNFLDILKKIGEGIKSVTQPVIKSSLGSSQEEILGGNTGIKGGLVDDNK